MRMTSCLRQGYMFADDNNDRKRRDTRKPSRAKLESMVQERTTALRSLSVRLLRTQDEERRRVARELHDTTGQTLIALQLQLASLGQRLKAGQEISDILIQTNELVDQAIQEVRTLCYLLHPPLLDPAGLSSAARWYVEGFSKRSRIKVRLDLTSQIARLATPIETALFRVLQESLTNVYRHSESRSADVRLRMVTDTVTLEVQDYGKGVPFELLEQFNRTGTGAGVGLAGMRERIEDLCGRLEISSGGKGTIVRASLPVTATSAEFPEI
jgi:two-component system NarL family sensor kinase